MVGAAAGVATHRDTEGEARQLCGELTVVEQQAACQLLPAVLSQGAAPVAHQQLHRQQHQRLQEHASQQHVVPCHVGGEAGEEVTQGGGCWLWSGCSWQWCQCLLGGPPPAAIPCWAHLAAAGGSGDCSSWRWHCCA